MAPRTFHVPTMANSHGVRDGRRHRPRRLRRRAGRPAHPQARPRHTPTSRCTPSSTRTGTSTIAWASRRGSKKGRPRVVAHENVPKRFNRYLRTVGLQEHINKIQFGFEDMRWPTDYVFPDVTYDDHLTLAHRRRAVRAAPRQGRDGRRHMGVGGRSRHPRVRRLLDLVRAELRQPAEGAALPGGVGRRVRADDPAGGRAAPARTRTGDRGCRRGTHGVERRGRLSPVDHRADVRRNERGTRARRDRRAREGAGDVRGSSVPAAGVRPSGVHRPEPHPSALGMVGRLPGAPHAGDRARAGARDRVARRRRRCAGRPRAQELAPTDIALACQLAEWAALAEPDDKDAQACVRDLFKERASDEASLMGRGIFMHAVREAKKKLGE